ncbi:MAG: methyltransferase domain-containing protein [Pseudonocardia sp.]
MMRRTGVSAIGGSLRAAELDRQLAQCELHRMDAELLFDRIGVGSGWHVLDVGCGPLGVLDMLAERVGPGGRVVGMDREPAMLDAAAHTLADRDVHGVGLLCADLADTGGRGGSFDLVHERLTLGDAISPRETVEEMVRLTRPGGWVALQDADLVSWTCEPASPAWDRLAHALTSTWIGDPHVGRRLPGLLRAAGLVDVEVDVHAGLWHRGEPHHALLPHLVELHRDRVVNHGPLTAFDLDLDLQALGEHLARPGTLVLSWTLFQAWGRKPFSPA